MRLPSIVVLSALASGCAPTVGSACNDDLARTVVYGDRGAPAYVGQAMLIGSCAGGGSFCHASTARQRYGVPYGMNFDPVLADRFPDHAAGARHLLEAQALSHRFRNDIFAQVVRGAMPPGEVGASIEVRYAAADGTPIPSIRSAEGREALRNWLACRSPVIESTMLSPRIPCTTDADCAITHDCDVDHGVCFDVGAIAAALPTLPEWSSIYRTIVSTTCATRACHAGEGVHDAAGLDLSTQAGALARLVGVPSTTSGCGTRIVAGDGDASLLVHKLEGTEDRALCGDPMPSTGGALSDIQVTAIRTWIARGAMDD